MSEVEVEIHGRIMIVAINRPAARNAADRAVAEAIVEAVDRLDSRDDLSAAVLMGRGGAFCAGRDLEAFRRGELARVDGRGAGLRDRPAPDRYSDLCLGGRPGRRSRVCPEAQAKVGR